MMVRTAIESEGQEGHPPTAVGCLYEVAVSGALNDASLSGQGAVGKYRVGRARVVIAKVHSNEE